MSERLVALYEELYKLTEPECGRCRAPRSCCDPLYCSITEEYASSRYGMTLEPTDHPTLKFMGPTGCVVAPHLRPLCTFHVCSINSLGFKPGDETWTERYFKLRDEITQLEWEENRD